MSLVLLERWRKIFKLIPIFFPAVHVFRREGALRRINAPSTKQFSASFPVLAERGALLSACRQRASTCRDKMALYNFKKIMVVPTAKVSFVRPVQLWNGRCFMCVVTPLWEAARAGRKKHGEHVLSGVKGPQSVFPIRFWPSAVICTYL